jgi:4,5:9,10-diseco-3-hydroxy-5,9,17-trioxoandrosta-1(10),2-diene-4-oate hydrolase
MSLVEEIGVPMGSPTVDADGVQIAYVRTGRGVPVVCLHAIGHGGRDFDAFAALVRDQFEVVRIDWPGQGRSSDDAKAPSATRYAELLGHALAALKIERPILLGNSIGGAAAVIHAASHPVRGVVLCNTGGLVEVTDEITRACNFMSRFFAAGTRKAWWFGPTFWAYYTFLVLPSSAARAQRKRIIAAGYDVAALLRDAWLSFGKPEADLRAIAATLDVPVWVAWAKGDRVIPLARCLPAIRAMKKARLTKFGGGHAAFLERPKQFARAFRVFAKTLD